MDFIFDFFILYVWLNYFVTPGIALTDYFLSKSYNPVIVRGAGHGAADTLICRQWMTKFRLTHALYWYLCIVRDRALATARRTGC